MRRRGRVWIELSENEYNSLAKAASLLDTAYSLGVDFGPISEDVTNLVENSRSFDELLSAHKEVSGVFGE